MNDQESLRQQLDLANRVLQFLEQQKAVYTVLSVPPELLIQLEDKQKEVASLKNRLSLIDGGQSTSVPDNLPRSTSSIFVGREQEVSFCLQALSKEQRWGIVIHGMGGIGKTELALEVATQARQRGMFDGYLFVSAKASWLTPDGIRYSNNSFSSLEAFCEEFARLLGKQELLKIKDSDALRQALINSLRGRTTLLIWDNLETLTDKERYRIAVFLEDLPRNNKAIVTSRVHVSDAVPFFLNQLSKESIFTLMDELGREHRPLETILRQADHSARLELYNATGGNPLILNWTLRSLVVNRGYSLEDSLKRLKDPSVARDVYTFLFSELVSVLTEEQKVILSALAAFESSANLKQLIEITDLSEELIRENLNKLRTLALLTTSGETYSLHPLTQNYVYDALGLKTGMAKTLIKQIQEITLNITSHMKALRYWVNYAEKHGHNYQSFRYLDAQWPNLAATARTLQAIASIPDLIKNFLKEEDDDFFIMLIGPAIKKTSSVLRAGESSKSNDELELAVLSSVSYFEKNTKNITKFIKEKVWVLKEEVLKFVEESQLTRGIYAASLIVELASFLRKFLLYRGEWDRQINLNKSAYNVAEDLQLSRFYPNAGWLAYDNAKIYQFRGDVREGQKWLEYAVGQMERCYFNKRLSANVICIRGEIAEQNNELDKAESLYRQALDIFRNLKSSRKENDEYNKSKDEIEEANTLHVLGKLTAKHRDFITANTYYCEAIEIYTRLQEDESKVNAIHDLGLLALEMNKLEEASLHFKESLELSNLLGYKYIVAKSKASLSEVFERQGKCDSEVVKMAVEALEIHESLLSKELGQTRDIVDRLKKIC
ncbi:MAG: NB-ARC domain-containing protein [Rhizonema sp. PD37]|nr:NB-ARC domain-containing protein [Rhizonema sp. PD37]